MRRGAASGWHRVYVAWFAMQSSRFDSRRQRADNGRVSVYLLQAVRVLGWVLLATAVLVPLGMLVVDAASGPPAWGELALSPRLVTIFLRTVAVALGASALALLLALPAVAALTTARGRGVRAALTSLMLFPLFAPPCVFAYSIMLLSSQPHGVGRVLAAIGFNSEAAGPIRAALALALWLWPIPALTLAAAFRHGGLAAYRLARLDAGAAVALLRAALPAMRGPLTAATAVVFLLALNDGTAAPLVLTRLWPAEMAPDVLDASLYGSTAAAILWKSWPILATTALAAALAWSGVRQMRAWFETDTSLDLGEATLPAAAWARVGCAAIVALLAAMPVLIFVVDLASAYSAWGAAISRAWTLYAAERRASLIVASLSAVAAVCVGLASVRLVPAARRLSRWLSAACLAGVVLVAVLPPELLAQAIVRAFNRPGVLGELYDRTPLAWLLAIVARFGFVPVALAWCAARWVPAELVRQAQSDGAGPARLTASIGLPYVARAVAAGALVFACLSLGEVAASFILIPPRFGGSLAVAIDNQMHYGRNYDVIVTTLMLLVPGAAAAVLSPLLVAARRKG